MILALLLVLLGQTADSTAPRRVDGRVLRGTRKGEQPLASQWVVLHRVGRDRSGPLDSIRTAANGRFSFRYRLSGDSSAIYFATTSFGGIVYPTSPFRGPIVSGDDASIVVFDTTSGPVAIKIGGRHLIIGARNASGRRPVGEVYDLANDSTVTAVARDSVTPVWTAQMPPTAVDFQINTNGELAAGAITRSGSTVNLFAPLSPGIRQLAFTYELPADAFPLSVPIDRPTGVFELLVQDPAARLQGAPLREVSPQSAEGRVFRRFLGQDLPANIVIGIDIPRLVGAEREKVYLAVGAALFATMVIALIVASRRSPRAVAPIAPPAETRAQALVRALATLDDGFERIQPVGDAARFDYEHRRAELKDQLASAIAAERKSPAPFA